MADFFNKIDFVNLTSEHIARDATAGVPYTCIGSYKGKPII